MSKYFRLASLLAALAPASLAAQAFSGQGGRTALPLLQLPASARALALGGAGTLLQGDDAALFLNPAQLLGPSPARPGATASWQSWLAGSSLSALSLAIPLAGGALGAGVQTLDYGSSEAIAPDVASGGERGTPTGERVTALELAGTLGYARALGPVRLGASVRIAHQRLADLAADAVAGDVGASTDWRGATVAASVQNLGATRGEGQGRGSLPTIVRVGAASPELRRDALAVRALVEVVRVRHLDAVPIAAVEARWVSANALAVLLRAGVRRDPAGDLASPASFGAGIAARHLGLDYAYRGLGAIGESTHRIGLRWWR